MTATRITKRTAALTAVLALLLAGLWGLGSTQQAQADLLAPITVNVANVSPPPGGQIYYAVTVNDTTGAAPVNFVLEATNVAPFGGRANPSEIDSTNIDVTWIADVTAFGTLVTVRWDVAETGNATAPETFYVGLQVASSTPAGTTLQPTFKLCQDDNNNNACDAGEPFITLTPPARTVGAVTTSVSATEATIGDTVTFTFNLPAGWVCGTQDNDADRECSAAPGGDVTVTPSGALTDITLSPASSSVASPQTITVTGEVAKVGAITVTLNVSYDGVTGAPIGTNDDSTVSPDPSATVNVWIGIIPPTSPLPGDGAVYDGTDVSFAIANLFSATATSATATLTFPPQFTGVQVVANPTGWTCSASGNTITCTTNSSTTIASGGTVALLNGGTNGNLSVVLTANPSALNTRSFQLQASVSYDFGGPTMSKSATKTLTQGVLRVDVSVAPFPDVLPNSATGVVLYTLNLDDVTPESPDPVLGNVQIVFSAPPEALQIVGVTGVAAGWSCTTSGLQVTCTRAGVSGFDGPVSGGVATVAVQLPANTGTGMVARTANVSATFDIYVTVGSTNVQTGAAIAALGNPGSATVFHPGTGIGTVSYNLVFGWNLITWAGQNNIAVGSPNGLGSIVSSISAVYTFDALTQQWRYWFPTPPASGNTLTTLQTGTAYFIYVTAPGGATLTVPAGP